MKTQKLKSFDEAGAETRKMFQTKIDEEQALNEEKESAERIARAEAELNTAGEDAVLKETQLNEIGNHLTEALQRMNQLEAENQKMKQLLAECSRDRADKITAQVMPSAAPHMDISRLRELDDETAEAAAREYEKGMYDYAREELMLELYPMLQEAESIKAAADRAELIRCLEAVPELCGIADMQERLDGIIDKNKIFKSTEIPLDEKYIAAFAIAKGIDSMTAPQKEPTVSELMEIYNRNSDFQEAVERKRAEKIKAAQSDIPVLSGSAGNGSIALDIPEKPKSFDEAGKLVKKLFAAK